MSKLKHVKFESTDGLGLPALFFEPDKKTDTVAIYLHGNGSGGIFYNQSLMDSLASALVKKGIAFFPFNNRGANYMVRLRKKVGEIEEKIMYGTSYELIKECIYDIDGAITYLKSLGYKTFYIIGISTGANKVVIYDYYKKNNDVSKYILLSGGDDTGLYFKEMGRKKFVYALKRAKKEIVEGHGGRLVPKYLTPYPFSWQALYDTINPDGDYNIFPFNEYMNHLHLTKKPLFGELKGIDKKTLVVYGELDEYCYGDVSKCVGILKKECAGKSNFSFQIIQGADHGFTKNEGELASLISDWLKKT